MIVNFKTYKINQNTCKLTLTHILYIKKKIDMIRLYEKPSLKGSKIDINSI